MTVAKMFAGIITGLCVTVMIGIAGIIALTSTVATEAQSPLPSATPLTSVEGAGSGLNLRLVFYGYFKMGVPQIGEAEINETGLSNIHDVTFTSIGGELSPNGRFIAYDNCSTVNRVIYLAEANGSKAQLVIPLNGSPCMDVRWSPDSTKLSYTRSQPDQPLRVFDIASKSDTLIPNTQGADWHWWSPAGNEIVYGRLHGRVGDGPVGRLLYITDLNGNGRQLTFAKDFVPCGRGLEHTIIDTLAPAWSPKGDAIAFTQGECLFVVSPTGGDLRQLTTPPYASRPSPKMPVTFAYSPRWSPDGRWIIFNGEGSVCNIGNGAVLKRISPDGKTIVEIGKLPYCGGTFSIAPFTNRPH